ALFSNTSGYDNTAVGSQVLPRNIAGAHNTAIGYQALYNADSSANTAIGHQALYSNTDGGGNTAIGDQALYSNTQGNYNTAIGSSAGVNVTGDDNVSIGKVPGDANVSFTTWIANVYDSVANGRAVYVNADNKIGTMSSSRRFKEQIKPMENSSEALFELKPVTFRYRKEVDSGQALSFGLIAEDVAEVSPELITRDREGNPETVRYEAVNAMLLNEFLKEHRKNEQQQSRIEQQDAKIARLEKQIETLTAGLQKVSAQLEATKSSPRIVLNDQ